MQVIFPDTTLRKIMQDIAPVMQTRTLIPILENVKVLVTGNSAKITASNLQTTIIHRIDCDSEGEFEFLIDYTNLRNILSVISGPLVVMLKGDGIELMSGLDNVYDLGNRENIANYPEVPEVKDIDYIEDVPDDLFMAIQSASKCSSTDELRPQMTGVCVSVLKHDKGILRVDVVGANHFNLYKKSYHFEKGKMPKYNEALIPLNAVKTLFGLTDANIGFGEKNFVAIAKDVMIIITRSEQKYIQYNAVFPKELPKISFSIPATELLKTLRKVNVFSVMGKEGITNIYSFKEGNMEISFDDNNTKKKSKASIEIEHSCSIESIGFGYEIVQKIISAVGEDHQLKVCITAANKPVYVLIEEDENAIALMMPNILTSK